MEVASAGAVPLERGRAGLGGMGADPARPGRDPVGRLAAARGRPERPGRALGQQHPAEGGGGELGHGRGGAGRPPARAPGGLAAPRPGAVADRPRPHLRLHPLRAGGPAGVAAGRRLPGRSQQRSGGDVDRLRRVRAAAHPHRVAAVAPLALVGPDRGRRGRAVAAGVDPRPGPPAPGVPGRRQPAGRAGAVRPLERDPGGRLRRAAGTARRGGVPAAAVPPGPAGSSASSCAGSPGGRPSPPSACWSPPPACSSRTATTC